MDQETKHWCDFTLLWAMAFGAYCIGWFRGRQDQIERDKAMFKNRPLVSKEEEHLFDSKFQCICSNCGAVSGHAGETEKEAFELCAQDGWVKKVYSDGRKGHFCPECKDEI